MPLAIQYTLCGGLTMLVLGFLYLRYGRRSTGSRDTTRTQIHHSDVESFVMAEEIEPEHIDLSHISKTRRH